MAASSNLIVPVVLWGRHAPTHCICSVYLAREQQVLATGCNDGQICIWDVDETLKITPRCLLFGHTAPVTCLARGYGAKEGSYLVSSSENGEMCVWDLSDGRCLENVKSSYIHTRIHSYVFSGTSEVRLVCNGYYAEILIMDAFSLETVLSLSSRVNPDWISAMHILRPPKSPDDVVVALSCSGTIKVWTFNAAELKGAQQLYEHESKPIRCLNALSLTCCVYNQRTMLVVCMKYWQIFDAGDFSLLCSMENRQGERWAGGDFVAADRVLVWSDRGKGFMYKLPTNCIVGSKDFHQKSMPSDLPFLYSVLSLPTDQLLTCPPAMTYSLSTRGHFQKLLLRGDCESTLAIWIVPDIIDKYVTQIQQEGHSTIDLKPQTINSLKQAWKELNPAPPGILDQLDTAENAGPKLTASIYLPVQGQLVCGRDDGSIVIVPATQTVLLQLVHGKHHQFQDWPPHQVLLGHNGAVTYLLYPYSVNSRYDIAHLVSGGVDFSVCLWHIYTGSLLHTFCVHAGEITQLLVPPENCSSRVLQCVCSVASDHSVALLGLKERRCTMLASRHLFPVQVIKWRPLDDFIVVGCTDGAVYIWQMETGHLDRVVHGLVAEEVLSACDEHLVSTDTSMANPAVHFFRGLRHRNLASIRQAAQRGLLHLSHAQSAAAADGGEAHKNPHAHPLTIQSLKTNPKDHDSHVLFFDVEALIIQLLSEEFASMPLQDTPATNAATDGLRSGGTGMEGSPDTQRKLASLLSKVKDTAENVGQRIQAKAESVGFKADSEVAKAEALAAAAAAAAAASDGRPRSINMVETTLTMEIAQLLLSFVHAWGLDADMDRQCDSRLGLLRPLCPISFGLLSRGGFMSLLLPFWKVKETSKLHVEQQLIGDNGTEMAPLQQLQQQRGVRFDAATTTTSGAGSGRGGIPGELINLEERTRHYLARGHWEVSTSLTTYHLLAIISIANTLMSMSSATFIPEQERKRKLMRRLSRMDSKLKLPVEVLTEAAGKSSELGALTGGGGGASGGSEAAQQQQTQIKQGWSLLAALHCILLPERVGTAAYKHPRVEMLARRWQDRCLEIREAAQALLLAELRRMGTSGRKALVEEWSPYLPNCFEPFAFGSHQQGAQATPSAAMVPQTGDGTNKPTAAHHKIDDGHELVEEDEEDGGHDADAPLQRTSMKEARRKQATSIVLLGVIGAEFGQDIEPNRRKSCDEQIRRSIVEGFGSTNYSLARHASKALAFLLLAAPTPKLPAHTPLRRAAIDLIGRGFTVWEPYVDVSKILLGLLELCCEDRQVRDVCSAGLPLTPAADSRRTARHSLSLIANARPPAFITTMAKEVARYNNLAQNAQAVNLNLAANVLNRAKLEIMRVIDVLIQKVPTDVADLIVEVMDISLHCLDHSVLKSRGLSEVFPAICRYSVVSYCTQTRRIAVGARNGSLAIYELRPSKYQVIPAHASPVTACAFSSDGKFLASYSCGENKLCFWQTATGLFGLGNSQTRLVRTYSTPPIPDAVKLNPLKIARLVWITNKNIALMLSDGSETRYTV